MAMIKKTRGGLADLYIGRSTFFKIFLVTGVVVISGAFIWYTFQVIERLQIDTRDQVDKYVHLWQWAVTSPSSEDALPFIFDEIIVKARFPVVVLDSNREPVSWRNIPGIPSDDTSRRSLERVKEEAEAMYRHNGEYPLNFGENNINYFLYGDSEIIKQLRVMPFVAIGIVLAFVTVAVIGFQNIRRSEERYIWVGMAKETAHQLGTPLSSLMGWLEVISPENRQDLDREGQVQLVDNTVQNMRMDVIRLQRVATRFSQIGSIPEVKECDLNSLVTDCVQYYRARLPFEGQGTQIVVTPGNIPPVRLNPELFSWVLENLVKNSLQAVDPKSGRVSISTSINPDRTQVMLEIADNGHGIPPGSARKIFRPGFTTKKRGWGMGLTLVKRIVEEYHVGRITLVRSQPGETVFQVTLPISGGL
ncbi:MAG: ATP-binding protein [Candidatus Zixiibacteriota bacterium]